MEKTVERPSLLVLVRHAESVRNVAKKGNVYFADEEARKVIAGIPDQNVPITEFGRQQALQTGRYLRKKFGTPDYFYHSGYKRTVETMENILKMFSEPERKKIKVRKNIFLREREPGYTYDMTRREVQKQFPWLERYWKTFGSFYSRPPGGENLADVAQRVYAFLNMLFRDRAGQKIFVVTHGHALQCFRYLLEHLTEEEVPKIPVDNCGVTAYRYDKKGKRLVVKVANAVYWK